MAALYLDLLRHGEARPGAQGGDAARALTPAGRGALAALGAQLAAQGVRYDRVLSSPLRRALESAEALGSALRDHPAVETLDELAPESSPTQVLDALRRLRVTNGWALLVGHQPL